MRRLVFVLTAALASLGASGVASAAPPEHEQFIDKDVTLTLPPLPECPAGSTTALELRFNEQFHNTFTETTFHVTNTLTGTFEAVASDGSVLFSGQFVNTFHDQGPGFPTEAFTNIISAVGTAPDGERLRIVIHVHFTVTANGDVPVDFERVTC